MTNKQNELLPEEAQEILNAFKFCMLPSRKGAFYIPKGWNVIEKKLRAIINTRPTPSDEVKRLEVPKGCAVVPKWPTKEMWEAMPEVSMYVAFDRFVRDYESMIRAAALAALSHEEEKKPLD